MFTKKNLITSKSLWPWYLLILLFTMMPAPCTSETIQRISVMNILLPVCPNNSCKSVYSIVTAEGGCFEWYAENPNLANITPIKTRSDAVGCSRKVHISARTTETNKITWVIARDKQSKEEFKCKVGFGEVSSVVISKRFDRINVGELFELQAEALDAHGNIFSSLEGWSFEWNLSNLSLVELRKGSNESKRVSVHRKEVEKSSFSDVLLVKGISPGQLEVSCRIKEIGLNILSPVKDLYIIDPFIIKPEEIYLMPRSNIDLDIEYVSKKVLDRKDKAKFTWEITQGDCGSIDSNGNFQSNDIECTTQVIVHDTRISAFNTATAIIHVVKPNQIRVGYSMVGLTETTKKVCKENQSLNENIVFSNEIQLIAKQRYIVKYFPYYNSYMVHYSQEKIHFTSNTYDFMKDNQCDFCNSKKKDSFIVTPKSTLSKPDRLKIVLFVDEMECVSVERNIMVHEQIRIENFGLKAFTLPYLGHNSQELYLIIHGGSGRYKYTTAKEGVITINHNVLYGKEIGSSIVKVEDEDNSQNHDLIEVIVSEVKDFTYLEPRQEIKLNDAFDISIIGLHNNHKQIAKDSIEHHVMNSFTNCTRLTPQPMVNTPDKISLSSQQHPGDNSNYDSVNGFIRRNSQLLQSVQSLYKIKEGSIQEQYLSYSNYGICDLNLFQTNNIGIAMIGYNLKSQMNSQSINSSSKAAVNIYKVLSLKHPGFDIYTKEIIKSGQLNDPYDTKNISLIYQKDPFAFSLENGLISWADLPLEITVHSQSKIAKVNKINKKDLAIQCTSYHAINERDIVEIRERTTPSLLIPRPAQSNIQIGLKCQNEPQHLTIHFISSLLKNLNHNIFQVPQQKESYYLRKDSVEIIRVYAFDEHKIMILNLDKIQGGSTITDITPKLFDTIKQDKAAMAKYFNSTSLPALSSEFVQDYVHFFKAGEATLIYQLPKLQADALIYIVDSPILSPDKATLYVCDHNELEIEVLYGSGVFNISLSDNSLAYFSYSNTARKIYINPKKAGILHIELTDVQMIGNPIARGVLYLSDVKKINLFGGGLLMVNNSLTINLEVIDTYDNVYTPDQVAKIGLVIDDSIGISSGVMVHYPNPTTKTIHSNFIVSGLVSGLYPITLIAMGVKSNTVAIEVFDRLEVFPPYLLLIPGSSYTLSITGGPQNSDKIMKKYTLLNTKIASIAKDVPEVSAHYIGNTTLQIELIYNHDYHKIYNDENDEKHLMNKAQVLCVENVPVRVEFPTDIKIIGASQRKIFTKSTIRLLTAFKYNNETFTYGVGKMKYKWDLQNKGSANIIAFSKDNTGIGSGVCTQSQSAVECQSSAMDTFDNQDDSIGVFLQSIQEGSITITLNVLIEYPSHYSAQPNQYSTLDTVKIDDQTYVNINEFYGHDLMKSAIYMIPFDVDHELHTSKNTIQKYTIESFSSEDSSPLISLSDSGRITSYYKKGIAYVKIMGIEKDRNNLPVVLPVYVSEFYSLFVEKTNNLINLEIGQEELLKVILQHDSGILFAEKFERMKLRVVESHPKIASAELVDHSSKLKLKALNQGQTHIILFHPQTRKIYDVFRITVSSTYHLANMISLNVGGTIQFVGKDKKRFEEISHNADWTSSNTAVLTIDPKTGIATGRQEGNAMIYLKTRDDGITKKMITVNVGKVINIKLDKASLPQYLTDISTGSYDKKEYVIPIDFYTSASESKLTLDDQVNLINQNLKFSCKSNNDIAIASSRNTDSKYECVITIKKLKTHQNIPQEIEITFQAMSNNDKYINVESFPFASSFSIKNNIRKLVFSPRSRHQKLYINNVNDLDFIIQDDALVRIDNVDKEKGIVELNVPESVTADFKDISLVIKNKVTEQVETVLMNYSADTKNSGRMFLGLISMDTIVDTITLILLLVIIVILIIYLSSPKEQPKQVYGNGNTYTAMPSNSNSNNNSNQRYSGPKGSGVRGPFIDNNRNY